MNQRRAPNLHECYDMQLSWSKFTCNQGRAQLHATKHAVGEAKKLARGADQQTRGRQTRLELFALTIATTRSSSWLSRLPSSAIPAQMESSVTAEARRRWNRRPQEPRRAMRATMRRARAKSALASHTNRLRPLPESCVCLLLAVGLGFVLAFVFGLFSLALLGHLWIVNMRLVGKPTRKYTDQFNNRSKR